MLKRQRLFDLFTVGLCLLMVLTPINHPSAHAQSAPPAALAPLSVGILDEFTQSALSEVITVYTEAQGYQVEQVPIDSPTALLEALATGTVDLALALPVDALVTHHHLPLNALPTDQTRLLQLIQSLGAKEGVVWATPTAIQYNHTFWVHAAMAEEIADLPTLLARFSDGTIPTVAPEAADAPPTICAPADQAEALAETVEALQAEVGQELDVTQVLIDDAPQPATPHSTPIITTAASFSGTLAVSAVPISATTGTFTATLPISATRASTSFFAPCTLAFALSTSQTMRAAGLVPLADPASFFPANPLTLVYRTAAFPAGSPLPPELDQVVATMDAAMVAELANQRSASASQVVPQAFIYQSLLERGQISLPTVTVGTHAETAQWLLGEMVVLLLEEQGYPVVDQTGAVTAVDIAAAVEEGTVDVAIALVGDLLSIHGNLAGDALPTEVERVFTMIAALEGLQLITDFPPASFSLTQVLLVDKDLAALGITDLSTLAAYMNRFASPFSICMDSDFFSHPTAGLAGLESYYQFAFQPDKILLMDDDSLFPAIQEGRCQVTIGTITDGRIPAWQLAPLADDKSFFPPNNPLPIVRAPLLNQHSQLRPLLESFLPRLDAVTMQQMTTRIELGADGIFLSGDEEQPADVARSFLQAEGLLPAPLPMRPRSK